MTRRVAWTIEDGRGDDTAEVTIDGDRFAATGRATNDHPEPYELGYDVRTGSRFVTEELVVEVTQGDEVRRLRLARSSTGAWAADLNGESAPLPDLGGALDCDLERCPTTNSMPVLRERLLERGEPVEFVMALVEVPALVVRRSRQRYEPMATRPDGSRLIRFVSLDSEFRSELTFDPDGLVIDYPQLGRRVRGA